MGSGAAQPIPPAILAGRLCHQLLLLRLLDDLNPSRFAGQAPEIAYNLGKACWFGLLVTASFGVGYNLFRLRVQEPVIDVEATRNSDASADVGTDTDAQLTLPTLAGLLTSVAVALTSNLHVILEWLYAQGVRLDGLIRLVDVYNFPEQAHVSGLWYIDSGWTWWWRASRVIEDVDLSGNHIEIIDDSLSSVCPRRQSPPFAGHAFCASRNRSRNELVLC